MKSFAFLVSPTLLAFVHSAAAADVLPLIIVDGIFNGIYVPLEEKMNGHSVFRAVDGAGTWTGSKLFHSALGWEITDASEDLIFEDDGTELPPDGATAINGRGSISHAKAPFHTMCNPIRGKVVATDKLEIPGEYSSLTECANKNVEVFKINFTGQNRTGFEYDESTKKCSLLVDVYYHLPRTDSSTISCSIALHALPTAPFLPPPTYITFFEDEGIFQCANRAIFYSNKGTVDYNSCLFQPRAVVKEKCSGWVQHSVVPLADVTTPVENYLVFVPAGSHFEIPTTTITPDPITVMPSSGTPGRTTGIVSIAIGVTTLTAFAF